MRAHFGNYVAEVFPKRVSYLHFKKTKLFSNHAKKSLIYGIYNCAKLKTINCEQNKVHLEKEHYQFSLY